MGLSGLLKIFSLFSSVRHLNAMETVKRDIEKVKAEAQLEGYRAAKLRAQNSSATSKHRAGLRVFKQKIVEADTIMELKEAVNEYAPDDNKFMKMLDHPVVGQVISKFLTGQKGMSIPEREQRVNDLLTQNPKLAEMVEQHKG